MELKVEYIPIEDIKPYENNAKLHPAFQIEQIKKSIQEFGFADPVALWHGEVVEGHGRLLAAQKLGMKVIPCIKLDTLTDEQRRAYGLIHNKLTMNSDFDIDLLAEELDSIDDIDMGNFGLEMPGDMISDLLDNDFASTDKGSADATHFDITFTFEADKRAEIEAWIKEKGKGYVVQFITDMAMGAAK